MRKIIILAIIVMTTIGCASILQKNLSTKDVVTEPKSYCQQVKLSINDIASYDDKDCYKFTDSNEEIKGVDVYECKNLTTAYGDLVGVHSRFMLSKAHQIKFPKKVFKMGYMTSTGYVACDKENEIIKLPESMCVKKQEDGSISKKTKDIYRGDKINEVEIINKRKATEKERKEALARYQKAFDDDYKKCNDQYNEVLTKWQEENEAKTFCGYVYQEWLNMDCNPPLNRICANLTMPLVECYNKGLIKLNPEYIKSLI